VKIQRYNNKGNVASGIYQNFDMIQGGKIFARVDNNDLYLTNDFSKLASQQLSREIYFSPSNFPLVRPIDFRAGSCFQDWVVPTSSYRFSVTPDHIDVTLIEKNLGIDEYQQRLHSRAIESIKKIYAQHDRVYLHYSGGIDSIVMLSFIIKLDLLKQTTLLYYRNLPEFSATLYPNQAFLNPEKIQAREKLFSNFADKVHSIIEETITLSDFMQLNNNYEFDWLPPYSCAIMMLKYPDGAHLGGHYGNQSLLHWWIFIDDILEAGHNFAQYEELSQGPVYSREHVTQGYRPNINRVTIEFKNLLVRSRMTLNRGPVKFYHPLMDEDTAHDLRSLHWKDIDFTYLLNAKLARDLIHLNVGSDLDQYITFDGIEGDDLMSIDFDVAQINPAIFNIPNNLQHHPEGVEWHRYELNNMNQSGRVSMNTMVSFKAINFLSKLCRGDLDFWSDAPVTKF
jgi:hypothetical protein